VVVFVLVAAAVGLLVDLPNEPVQLPHYPLLYAPAPEGEVLPHLFLARLLPLQAEVLLRPAELFWEEARR
jgi:hypothetical protein